MFKISMIFNRFLVTVCDLTGELKTLARLHHRAKDIVALFEILMH